MTIPITLAPPNLALAPDKYDRKYEDLAANIHDKFYKQVCNDVNFILNNGVFNEATTGTTGTWNPVLNFGSPGALSNTGMVTSYVAGEYQLLGDYALITWQFILTNKGTATGGKRVKISIGQVASVPYGRRSIKSSAVQPVDNAWNSIWIFQQAIGAD